MASVLTDGMVRFGLVWLFACLLLTALDVLRIANAAHFCGFAYGWIAGQIGKPEASRAVGQALGRNPLPIIIPCHRVLAGDGGLGGFTGGLEMKRYLLSLENTELALFEKQEASP